MKKRAVICFIVFLVALIILSACSSSDPVKYTLEISKDGEGTVKPTVGKHQIVTGTVVTLSASPADEYIFEGWGGPDLSKISGKNKILINKNMKIKAIFKEIKNVKGIQFSIAGGTYNGAQSVELSTTTVDADIYYTVDGSDPSASNGTLYSGAITINEDTILKAVAVKSGMTDSSIASADYVINYSLTLNVDPAGSGAITADPDKVNYKYNETVNLTATAESGYDFSSWSGDLASSTNPETITMDDNKTVTAEFAPAGITGILLDAKAGSDFIGVLYTRNGNIYYNQLDSDQNWENESSVGVGSEGRISIDSFDEVHAVYTSNYDIGYRKYNSGNWTTEEIIQSNNGGECNKPDITIDSNNNPHITYTDTMGDTAGTRNQDDIMYAYKNGSSFVKELYKSGQYDRYWKDGYYYEKGSKIALDEDNNKYILLQYRYYSHDMYINHSREIKVEGINTQTLGSISTNNNRFDIYSLRFLENKLYALYRDTDNIKLSEMNVNNSGEITSHDVKTEFAANSAYSFAINNNDIVIGRKNVDNLEVYYNGSSQEYSGIFVEGDAVSIVYINGDFYVIYTNNENQIIEAININIL